MAVSVVFIGLTESKAQSDYTIAAGLGIDFASGGTFIGPSAKFFLAEEHAIQGEFTFESGVSLLTALYEYNGDISGADGLNWFAGAGLSFVFISNGGGTEIAFRPVAGLEYKITDVPLAFSFDWRPFVGLGDLSNEIGAFGLGIRYVIQ